MKIHNRTLEFVLAGSLLAAMTTAQAGGPLATCADGVPFVWENNGTNIVFNPDQGDLGPLSNAQATAQVQFSFDQWGAVGTSTASYLQGDSLPVDVDVSNFDPFLNAVEPDFLSAIVYDANGEIFDLLFGPGSGILGFAGPEWGDVVECTITEGLSFLNGPAFDEDGDGMPSDEDIVAATDVMVHEFGHFSNLAHVQVNGGIGIGDFTGPGFDAFPRNFPADFDFVETMYPFYFGPGIGTATPELDDIASLSSLYPTSDYRPNSVTIAGSVRIPDGITRVSGINVIARNVDDPFDDASGILSGADTDFVDPASSDFVGTFTFTGMTPGASYAIFVDEIIDGGFSTTPISLAPSPEEFYSGPNESNSDDPAGFVLVSGAAGDVVSNIDFILNQPQPGDPLPAGIFGDESTRLFTPFPIDFCGTTYDSIYVNGNGNITFGAPSIDFSESAGDLLTGPPRIAGLWDDLNASAGGELTFDTDESSFFKVIWSDVPEFDNGGANSFSINLKARKGHGRAAGKGNDFEVRYGDLTATDGLAGYSCGGAIANGFETETDIGRKRGKIHGATAVFEQFVEPFLGSADESEVVDLAGKRLRYRGVGVFADRFEGGRGGYGNYGNHYGGNSGNRNNNTVADATRIRPPFDNARRFAAIDLDASDIDFYRFRAKAGETVAIEVVRGQLDSLIGLFDADTGAFLGFDDDGGDGVLSRFLTQPLPQDFNLAVGVTTFPDFGFTGAGGSSGAYVLSVRTYKGEVLFLGDDDSLEIPLPGEFEFQDEEYESVFVNSNGNLTFGEGDTNFSENVFDLLNGAPRISTFWDDLDPTGAFGNPGLYIVETGKESIAVHGVSVSEFFSSSPNYFSVEFDDEGDIELSYGPTARSDALVGVSQGRGADDPGPTDLSREDELEVEGTVYENFPNGLLDRTKTTPYSDFDLLFGEVELEIDD